jgi:nicotinamidase-related amidase
MTRALVLLDLQAGILRAPGLPWDDPATPDRVLQAAKKLLDAARSAKAPVVHVGVNRARHRGGFDQPRTAMADRLGKAPRDAMPLLAGTPEVAFLLQAEAEEDIVHKVGVSAFQGTQLDQLLRSHGVEEVVIGGAFTHMVVESTARQGFDLGYRMVVCSEICCAPKQQVHEGSLNTGIPNFARVVSLDEAAGRFSA